MLIIGFRKIGKTTLAEKYPKKVNDLDPSIYLEEGSGENGWPINYIEAIKKSCTEYQITLIPYIPAVVVCLDALQFEYYVAYPEASLYEQYKEYWEDFSYFNEFTDNKFVLSKDTYLEDILRDNFDWIAPKEDLSLETTSQDTTLTFERLLDDKIALTENDFREMKLIQNKLKVGLVLQAKSSLNRVLKLSQTLDKLYDKLLERVDDSLDTTDTASLLYTTEYISKALNETNQFIMTLVNNDKIQNFFIIDNSSVLNIGNDRVDINKREKIRKAVEIVMNNIDSFTNGDFENLKDPNNIEIVEEINTDANSTT